MSPLFHLLRLQGLSIHQQLRIEEALLRADDRNWCLLHCGAPPAIVMGVSGRHDELVDEEIRQQLSLPLIRRFSGGGTVVVDEETCFATLIVNSSAIAIPPFPEAILRWSADLYRPLFTGLDFRLREHDYTVGDHKCGGNAQYICRGRWLHHTSFLWDYRDDRMTSLKMPRRTPDYREGRHHSAFLCKLRHLLPHYCHPDAFLDAIVTHFPFKLSAMTLSSVEEVLSRPHRSTSAVIES